MTTKSLAGGVTLPSLSPLAGRRIKPSIALEDLSQGLRAFGFDMGWDDGNLQVNPPGSIQAPLLAPTLSIDTFLGGMTRDGRLGLGRSGRPRVASSVTFSTAKSQPPGSKLSPCGASAPYQQRPHSSRTPTSPVPRKLYHSTQMPPSLPDPPLTPPGTSRFAHAEAAAAAAAASAAAGPSIAASNTAAAGTSGTVNMARAGTTGLSATGPATLGTGGASNSLRPFTAPPHNHQHVSFAGHDGPGASLSGGGGGESTSAAVAGAPSAAGTSRLNAGLQTQGPPANSGVVRSLNLLDTSPTLHGSVGSARFHRLARSVDSLQSLKVANGGGLNSANLQALHEPHWAPSFNSASPIIPQGPLLESLKATSQQGDLEQLRETADDVEGGECSPDGRWHPNEESSRAGQHQYLPRFAASMPLVDIQKGAEASLAASKQAAANGEVHTAQRPFTARAVNSSGFRSKIAHPMSDFKPSRGHALEVFQHLDKDKNGKVTLAEIEDVGLSLGFSLEQAQRLFRRMDKADRGYLKASDWGDKEFIKVVEFFSLMYMQKFMGLPTQTSTPEQVGKYWAMQELRQVKTLPAAISMARTNAVMRASHAANYSDFILNCFKFIDTDQKGSLNLEGVRDGFSALGVHLTEDVARQLMNKCGSDGNFNYQECVHRLFGTSGAF